MTFTTGNKLLREGKLEEAIASYEKAIELNPQFAWCYQNLGDALEKAGRIDEAIAVFRRAVANCPEYPWCFYKLGVILGQQGEFQEGIGYLRQAIELKKDVPEFYLGLGSGLVKLGQWSEAVDCINQAVGMWEGKVGILNQTFLQAEADFYLAEAKSGLGQWSEAVEFYSRSWEVNPGRIDCCMGWATALGKLGRWSEAVELYRQGMVLFENSGELWFGLGKALGQLERWEEAVVEYGRAVGLGFAGAEVRHHLGYALGQLGRWEEAVVQYRLVVEVNRKSAVVRHQLGYALMRLGRWGEAEIELRKAAELHPGSAVIWQHLGDVLGELGERDEAESAYKRALELKSGKSSYVSDLSSPLPKMKGVTSNSLTREKIRKIDQKFDANYQGKRDSILKSRPKGSTYLNVLFVLYGNIDSNGGYHAQLHGTRLLEEGVDCIFAVPDSSNNEDVWRRSLQNLSNPVRILPYSAFSIPGSRLPFANGGGPDVIHAWTPREVVRKCVERLLKQYSCPLVIHLEDNEEYLTAAKVGRTFDELVKLPEAELDRVIPGDRYHPIKGRAFLQQAQGLTMIIETLKGFNIGNVPELVLGPPVDESLFFPRPINQELRRSLGISEGHVVLAYTGNVHSGNRDEVGELYQAVEVLNQQGCPTVLLRTGLKGEEMGVESRERSYEKYLGWVERGEVPEILAAADVLVQPGVPGVFNDERVPSKLLEYFAMGRPVVLPKTNLGLRVKHGLEGYVLARCDAEGIVAAVQEIKADGQLARRLSDGAVDFYLSQVEQGFMGVKLNDFYGRLTGKALSFRDEKVEGNNVTLEQAGNNAWFEEAKRLEQEERFEDAVAAYRKGISSGFDGAEVRHHLGYALMRLSRWEEAKIELRKTLEFNQGSVPVWQHLGDVLLKLGDMDEAEKCYKKAVEIKPSSAGTQYKLGNIQKAREKEEENKALDVAIANYQKSLQVKPNNWEDSYKLADALLKKGKAEEAIAHYRQSIQLNPNYSWSHHNLGEALVKQGNLSEAISEYQIALKLNPKFFWSNQKLELV